MMDLSKTDFDPALAEAVEQTSWLPPEAPLAMPRQRLEHDRPHPILTTLIRALLPLRRV